MKNMRTNWCVFVVIISLFCTTFTSCGSNTSTDNTAKEETVITQVESSQDSFSEIVQTLEPLNNNKIDFNDLSKGYIFVNCPVFEFSVKDVTCSDSLLRFYNELYEQARMHQVPFLLVLNSTDGKTLEEHIAIYKENFNTEPDFTKINDTDFKYPIYFDQFDVLHSKYDIVSYPTMLFLDMNGNVLETVGGWSEETETQCLELLPQLYSE